MSEDFLQKIIDHKKSLLDEKRVFFKGLKKNAATTKLTRYGLFKKQISNPERINFIAEIKKASPSRGLIRPDFDVMHLAKMYIANGAAAISVVTEDKFFLGKYDYLRKVSGNFNVPVLMKDFIIDDVQIYEAFSLGASAVLLIVAILDDGQIRNLIREASLLDMDCLVEVHDEEELERAIDAQASIIGINHRDLHTFAVDLKVSERLVPRIPKDKVIVVESGIKTHEDVAKLKKLGAHAVLIGETFLREEDVGKKIREVMAGDIY